MPHFVRPTGVLLTLMLTCSTSFSQVTPPKDPMAAPMPSIAATVNGQAINEAAVERALQAVPEDERAKARQEVLQYLVDNSIIDQYLAALKVAVEPKEIDEKLAAFKEDVKKHEQDYAVMLKRMKITEPELKEQIFHQLRWEKFVNMQASDEKLKALFNHMPEAFDGTTIRARHILIDAGTDAKLREQATVKLQALKAQIEKDVAAGLAKLPADADNLTKEKQRQTLIEELFGDAAKQNSSCPSKTEGGDLRWFPRYGSMVEPFSRAAYALKPFQISDVVTTTFGCHLIVVVGRKDGIPTKFEDAKVKDAVKEVYESRLKDAVIDQMKPRAKIEIMPVK
ncbi:MAG: peptidylprolyl isomerase [Planctomycetes bacterium]|nr:peptidylprolyl isomerase [Planctomycetota bacterium]